MEVVRSRDSKRFHRDEVSVVWVICCINLLTIVISFQKRVLLYSLLNAVFLFLVTGQAFQIQSDLETRHTVQYLFNFINDAGFHLALWYVLGISCVSLALAVFSKGYTPHTLLKTTYRFEPSWPFYVILLTLLSIFSVILILVVVGLSEFLNSSRPGFQSGSTIFLVLISLGSIPLLLKILSGSRINIGDYACCLITVLVTGTFSRIDLIYIIVAILLALYYTRGWADKPLTLLSVGPFLLSGVAVAFVIVIIGALHDAQNYVQGSLDTLITYILANPEKSILSIEYNYRVGIEGMSGIAGILSQYVSYPGTAHPDLGLSWILQGMIQWFPGIVKEYVSSISDLSISLNWYTSSIVATAAETFFMDFGWAGIILYPVTVYLLAWHIPLRSLRSARSPLAGIISYVVMALTIHFTRGPLAVWIAKSISYPAAIVLAWPLFRQHFRQIKENV